jgi:hypothetical protein
LVEVRCFFHLELAAVLLAERSLEAGRDREVSAQHHLLVFRDDAARIRAH